MALRDAFMAVSPSPPTLGGGAGEQLGDLIATLIPLADAVRVIASASAVSAEQMAAIDKQPPNFDEAFDASA